jgi:transcription elongation factor GreB
MSKAFTRESDGDGDLPDFETPQSLPPGAANYVTPDGVRRLKDELERLVELERARKAATKDQDGEKGRLQSFERRIRHLRQSLQSALVVPAPEPGEECVRFGATVAVREPGGGEARFRIVGVDEADADRGWVSWISPIARALMNARTGQRVRFKLPGGDWEIEIIAISYDSTG